MTFICKLIEKFLAFIGIYLLQLSALSWRKHFEGLERFKQVQTDSRKALVAFWHGKYLALFPLMPMHNGCVFTSVSKRGDIIKMLIAHFKHTAYQLPEYAPEVSMTIMREALTKHQLAGVAVDGPRGPYHLVHHGVIELASELGYVVVPVSVASNFKLVLSQRWDRFEIPLPFSRVAAVIGEPILLPPPPIVWEKWGKSIHDALQSAEVCAVQALQHRSQ